MILSFVRSAIEAEPSRLKRRIRHPVALISQIEDRKFHLSCHVESLRSAFISNTQSIIDPPAAPHAALSQHPGQHLQYLCRAHPPALDQTYDHPQIAQHSHANPALKRLQVAPGLLTDFDRRRFNLVSLLVLDLLFDLAFRRLVVLGTAFVRTLLAVRLSAPKRTPEILTAGVTRMGQEENAAMPTTRQTPPQAWIGP
jgi:hypothetical protein